MTKRTYVRDLSTLEHKSTYLHKDVEIDRRIPAYCT